MDDMNVTLSLVIPCYNCSETLNRALISVDNQTRYPDEIIVVDDCSDDADDIYSIVSRYKNIKLIRNKRNLGASAVRNIGIWSCKSTIITFLDSDDECHERRFEMQLQHLKENNVVSCAYADSEFNHYEQLSNYTEKYRSPLYFIIYNKLVGASLMAYVSTLKKVGGYDEQFKGSEDYDLWLRLLINGYSVKHLKDKLYYYNDTPNSLSKDKPLLAKLIVRSVCKNFNSGNSFINDIIKAIALFKIMLTLELNHYGNINVVNIVDNSCLEDVYPTTKLISTMYELSFFRVLAKIFQKS